MRTEIPDFLLEMSKQIREQDNRSTADPIYQVRCKSYLVTEEGYDDSHWELHSDDGEGVPIFSTKEGFDNSDSCKELFEHDSMWCDEWLEDNGFIELDSDEDPASCFVDGYTKKLFIENFDFESFKDSGDDWPSDCRVIHMQETEEVIKTCLTKADAEWFIWRKQHDYPKLYTYVESMVFCPQMIELRNWILSLTENEKQ